MKKVGFSQYADWPMQIAIPLDDSPPWLCVKWSVLVCGQDVLGGFRAGDALEAVPAGHDESVLVRAASVTGSGIR